MRRNDDDGHVHQALLTSLLDDDPDKKNDPREGFRSQIRRLKEHVRRDLQALLNTRHRCLSWPKELKQLDKSLLDYGVADLTGANLSSPARRDAFLRDLATAIRRHDPRFQAVRVTTLENADPTDRTLRFRIEATLRVETASETAVFDFQLEPASRRIEQTKSKP